MRSPAVDGPSSLLTPSNAARSWVSSGNKPPPVWGWYLNPSDVFSEGEALRWPSFKLEAEALTLRLINPSVDQAQRK